jgi:hypothetical protein
MVPTTVEAILAGGRCYFSSNTGARRESLKVTSTFGKAEGIVNVLMDRKSYASGRREIRIRKNRTKSMTCKWFT